MKIEKIVSFGDSFVFGSEIENNENGELAWPGIAAKKLGLEYETLAIPGCGNESITKQIFEYFSKNKKDNVLAVINWTWKMRWDYPVDALTDKWSGLGPTCVPSKLSSFFSPFDCNEILNFYNKYILENDRFNISRSLMAIHSAQSYLIQNDVPNVQTMIDYTIIDNSNVIDLEFYDANRDSTWPVCNSEDELYSLPSHILEELHDVLNKNSQVPWIEEMRNLIKENINSFPENMSFLEWAQHNQFDITEEGLHPLSEAHVAAANYWIQKYKESIQTHERQEFNS